MSIVIDSNTLSLVFCPTPNDDFGPIKEWVVQGAGRIVVGGTKYKEELRRVSQALRFVNELNKIGKVLIVSDHDVDRLEEGIKKIVSPKCDDPHLIALIGVSRCPLICSRDKRADEFLSDCNLYPWKTFRPKIYKGKRHADKLLINENANAKCFCDSSHNPNFEKFLENCFKNLQT